MQLVIEHFSCVNKAGGVTCWDSVIAIVPFPEEEVDGGFPLSLWQVYESRTGTYPFTKKGLLLVSLQRAISLPFQMPDWDTAAYGCVFF